jgi:hypothetical protein
MNTAPKPTWWFPAKRYGWGWGVPTCWQGWAVLALYFVLLAGVIFTVRPEREPFHFVLAVTGLSAALVAVCWLKGEPPRWRWGEKKR